MIIDGRALANTVLVRTKARAEKLARRPKIVALVCSETSATKSYLAIKAKRAADAGCVLGVQQFPESASTEELQSAIATSDADAIIVQLPLPASIDAQDVCDAIPAAKDADVLSSAARAAFENMDLRNPYVLPPVVGAMHEIFTRNEINPKEKKAVVIGDGWLVGNPCAKWLAQQGADVTTVTSKDNLSAALGKADIIISGAGSPHLIKPEMIKEGVILIDAGTSESNGTLAGDADPACADKCSIFTPVPGGVGPLAVAKLFENVVTLAERAMKT